MNFDDAVAPVTRAALARPDSMRTTHEARFKLASDQVRASIATLESGLDECLQPRQAIAQVLALLWSAVDQLDALGGPPCENAASARAQSS